MLQFPRVFSLLSLAFFTLVLAGCGPKDSVLPPSAFTLGTVTPSCLAGTPPVISVRLIWNRSNGASAYDIFRDGELLDSRSPTARGFTDEQGLSAGHSYNYFVVARNAGGSRQSETVSTTINADICSDGHSPEDPMRDSARQVSAGRASSIVLLQNGTVLTWGNQASSSPAAIPGLSNIRSVSAGSEHFLVLHQDGSVSAWGENWNGALGNGSEAASDVPVRVPGVAASTGVSAGRGNSFAVSGGAVYSWGNNDFGKLGNPSAGTVQRVARPVAGLTDIAATAAGSGHSMALHSDGSVWTWGSNKHGQLGVASDMTMRSTPERVIGLTDVKAVAANGNHSLALQNDGTVWAWGANNHGQLGLGDTEDRSAPLPISGLTNITGIAAGGGHSLAVDSDGTVWGWGTNYHGQVGEGSDTSRFLEPVPVAGLSTASSVAAGGTHSLAALSDGSVWAWGSNEENQIGNNSPGDHLQPVMILPGN